MRLASDERLGWLLCELVHLGPTRTRYGFCVRAGNFELSIVSIDHDGWRGLEAALFQGGTLVQPSRGWLPRQLDSLAECRELVALVEAGTLSADALAGL